MIECAVMLVVDTVAERRWLHAVESDHHHATWSFVQSQAKEILNFLRFSKVNEKFKFQTPNEIEQ
jgi:hypothetical protein